MAQSWFMTSSAADRTRTDAEVKDDVVTGLRRVPDVDATHVGVPVAAGVVTLSGQVDSCPEKLAAGRAARRVRGVCAVSRELILCAQAETSADADLTRHVDDRARVVTVEGTVRSWAERRQVELTCWSAPGVTGVVDELTVQP